MDEQLKQYLVNIFRDVREKTNVIRLDGTLAGTLAEVLVDARGLLHAALWFWDHVQREAEKAGLLDERPLHAPQTGEDLRFTYGLLFEVCGVLTKHRYPRPVGEQAVKLQQALYKFLYEKDDGR